jgi:hypothetical protein
LLERCVDGLKEMDAYRNDERYLRVWLSYADTLEDPEDVFNFLRANNIAQNLALFYSTWAYIMEGKGYFPMAEKLYEEGQRMRAQPEDLLAKQHTHFQQRMLNRVQRMNEKKDRGEETDAGDPENDFEQRHAFADKETGLKPLSSTKSMLGGRAQFAVFQGPSSSTSGNGNENGGPTSPHVAPIIAAGGGNGGMGWQQLAPATAIRKENSQIPGPWHNTAMPQRESLIHASHHSTTPSHPIPVFSSQKEASTPKFSIFVDSKNEKAKEPTPASQGKPQKKKATVTEERTHYDKTLLLHNNEECTFEEGRGRLYLQRQAQQRAAAAMQLAQPMDYDHDDDIDDVDWEVNENEAAAAGEGACTPSSSAASLLTETPTLSVPGADLSTHSSSTHSHTGRSSVSSTTASSASSSSLRQKSKLEISPTINTKAALADVMAMFNTPMTGTIPSPLAVAEPTPPVGGSIKITNADIVRSQLQTGVGGQGGSVAPPSGWNGNTPVQRSVLGALTPGDIPLRVPLTPATASTTTQAQSMAKTPSFTIFEDRKQQSQLSTPLTQTAPHNLSGNGPCGFTPSQTYDFSAMTVNAPRLAHSLSPWEEEHYQTLWEGLLPLIRMHDDYQEEGAIEFPQSLDVDSVEVNDTQYRVINLLSSSHRDETHSTSILSVQPVGEPNAGDDVNTSSFFLQITRPACGWEFYIIKELQERVPVNSHPLFMQVHGLCTYRNASLLITSQRQAAAYSLQDVIDMMKESGKPLDEALVMFFAIEILKILDSLQQGGFLHCQIRPATLRLRMGTDIPTACYDPHGSAGWSEFGFVLTNFSHAIDMHLYPENTAFSGPPPMPSTHASTTDNTLTEKKFLCPEMLDGKKQWTWQADYYSVASILHLLLHNGKPMEVEVFQPAPGELSRYRTRSSISRYHQVDIWEPLFDALLNVTSLSEPTSAVSMRNGLEEHLKANPTKSKSIRILLNKQMRALKEVGDE